MEDVLKKHPALVRAAMEAVAAEGYEPRLSAVRGGTDGATLSWRGIPCPNIGFGGRNCHGEREFLIVEEFEAAYRVVLRLATRRESGPREGF
jgi:tripeptide aminopeptidase